MICLRCVLRDVSSVCRSEALRNYLLPLLNFLIDLFVSPLSMTLGPLRPRFPCPPFWPKFVHLPARPANHDTLDPCCRSQSEMQRGSFDFQSCSQRVLRVAQYPSTVISTFAPRPVAVDSYNGFLRSRAECGSLISQQGWRPSRFVSSRS